MDVAHLFASGRVADLLLAVMALEFIALTLSARPGRRRATVIDLVFTIAPGACLALALRTALTGAPWLWTGVWLAAALPVHIGDLVRRRMNPTTV